MIAINSNCDITIYLNCGGRSTEVSEAVECYPELLKREEDGKRGSVMKKMVLIANSANMNLAAREYSIYTGFFSFSFPHISVSFSFSLFFFSLLTPSFSYLF